MDDIGMDEINMDEKRTRKLWLSRTRWGRAAMAAPLAVALTLGAVACADLPVPYTDPPGGKADSPDEVASEVAASTMRALPERPGMFDVVRDPADQWYVRLLGPGGDIYLTSAGYSKETSALAAILVMKENGVIPDRYKAVADSGGGCVFELRAANYQVMARSALFKDCLQAAAGAEATRSLVAGVVQFEAAVSGGARFELWRAPSDKKWYFMLSASDKRTLLESQAYSGRQDVVTGIASVRTNGKLPERYQVLQAADATFFVRLKAKNGQEIARSDGHTTAAQAQGVITESVALLTSEQVGNPW